MNNILMYHSIGESACPEIGAGLYCVGIDKFREQIGLICESKTPITITFDDGFENNYTNAYPALKEFGLKAFFFILAGKAQTPNYMDWRQIVQLRNAGMIIGSHGMTHRILTRLTNEELRYELVESKKIIEDKLRQQVDHFSIPRGFYNRRVLEKIKKAGYKTVFTSKTKDCDGFKSGRIAVKADWDLDYFSRVITTGLPLEERIKEIFKDVSKKLFGINRYDWVRKKLLD